MVYFAALLLSGVLDRKKIEEAATVMATKAKCIRQ